MAPRFLDHPGPAPDALPMHRTRTLFPALGAFATVATSVLLGLAAFLASPAPAYAADACSPVFNFFDQNATNGGNLNPGGTGINLAYNSGTTFTATTVNGGVGYTNGVLLNIDIWSLDPAGCAGLGKSNFYVDFSRWHEAIAGRTTSGGTAAASVADNWGSVDNIPATRLTTASFRADWSNDYTGLFSLDSPDTTVASGTSYTVYGDVTACDVAQGASVNGFSPGWGRRSADGGLGYGIFYWLAGSATTTNSKYYDTSEKTGGGGKGFCINHVNTGWSPYFHGYDTIVYDTVAPLITTFTAPPTNGTATLTIAATDSSTPWLMAFSNSPACAATSTSSAVWSNWEPYATSKSGWAINTTAYGGSTGEGAKTTCIRVMDRAGNIAMDTLSVRYDVSAPVCTAALNAGAGWTASTTVSVALVCSDASGTNQMRFSNNGSNWTPYEAFASSKTGWSIVTGYGGTAGDGSKTVTATVTDLAGNAGTVADTIGLDRTGPVISGFSPSGSSVATNLSAYPVGFATADAGAGGVVTYLARGEAAATSATCSDTGWSTYGTESYATSGFVSVGLAHATCYRWRVRAVDALGNETTAVSGTLLVDQVAPVINAFLLGDGSGLSTTPSVAASVTASDGLSGITGVRWSTDAGYDWASTPWLAYDNTTRYPTLTLTDGAGDYGLAVQVRDAAGNIATSNGVIGLQTTTRMPQLVLGARIVDCAAPGNTLSVNSSGTVYWPVGRDLCLVPLPATSTGGVKVVNGVTYTGTLAASGPLSFTLVSGDPCVAPCSGVVGRFPAEAYGQTRPYSDGSAATYLRLRLDRETTNAATSLTAVSLAVRVTVTVTWSAPGYASTTETYSALLQLQIRSLATGQRPG